MLGHKSTEVLFDVYEKFIPRRTRLDGSALIVRMKEESHTKTDAGVCQGNMQEETMLQSTDAGLS